MVSVADASADRWDDVVAVFGTRGDPARCWCQWYVAERYQHEDRAANRDALHTQLSTAAQPLGVLAYDGDRPVGWCAVAPRSAYPRLARMRVGQATADEHGLWSVTCFVVPPKERRRGIAAALLAGAIDLARRQGARVIEAYAVDGPTSSAGLYPGPLPIYERAGFVVVARPSNTRAVVRLAL